jgi:hypothetical protein
LRKALAPRREDVKAGGAGWQIGDRHDRHFSNIRFEWTKPIY